MSFEFHKDRNIYFNLQKDNCEKFIIPFIEKHKKIDSSLKVLEVGCKDGGVLLPFLNRGCHITGVEISADELVKTKERFAKEIENNEAEFIASDIHDFDSSKKKYDIIILKDVIEHVFGHEELIIKLKSLLSDEGVIYFGYPPWQNPFGGHQQVADHKLLSRLPYYHLLPNFLYLGVLKLVNDNSVKYLKMTKETRISIEKFRRIIKNNDLTLLEENLYLVSPMYEAKFGLKPRKQFSIISAIPYLRNFFTTTSDSLVCHKK